MSRIYTDFVVVFSPVYIVSRLSLWQNSPAAKEKSAAAASRALVEEKVEKVPEPEPERRQQQIKEQPDKQQDAPAQPDAQDDAQEDAVSDGRGQSLRAQEEEGRDDRQDEQSDDNLEGATEDVSGAVTDSSNDFLPLNVTVCKPWQCDNTILVRPLSTPTARSDQGWLHCSRR